MNEIEEALEKAARSVTAWVIMPLIVAFIIGLVVSWMF
jgi:hypothetical protein